MTISFKPQAKEFSSEWLDLEDHFKTIYWINNKDFFQKAFSKNIKRL